jgi:hypothetical protein
MLKKKERQYEQAFQLLFHMVLIFERWKKLMIKILSLSPLNERADLKPN